MIKDWIVFLFDWYLLSCFVFQSLLSLNQPHIILIDAIGSTDLKARYRPSRRLEDSNLYRFAFFYKYTLLHAATKAKMINYCRQLVFYGFDIQMKPFDDDQQDYDSAWDVSIYYPSKINEYFTSVLVESYTMVANVQACGYRISVLLILPFCLCFFYYFFVATIRCKRDG